MSVYKVDLHVHFLCLLLYDQLQAALLIGRNAVTWRSSLSNDEHVGGRPWDIAMSHGYMTMHYWKLAWLALNSGVIIKKATVSKSQIWWTSVENAALGLHSVRHFQPRFHHIWMSHSLPCIICVVCVSVLKTDFVSGKYFRITVLWSKVFITLC